jgi:hypothetical protein
MRFDIHPFTSVGPLRWGMTVADVAQALGPPTQSSRNSEGDFVELRDHDMVSCTYSAKGMRLVEVGFSRRSDVAFWAGLDLVATPPKALVLQLLKADPTAARGFGSFVFPQLGLSLTGYWPEEPDTKAATAFAPHQWDAAIPLMKEKLPQAK